MNAVRVGTSSTTACIVIATVVIAFLLYGSAALDIIIDLVRVPSIHAIAGTLCLALGSILWYAGIAYSSASYRYPYTRDIGKTVL